MPDFENPGIDSEWHGEDVFFHMRHVGQSELRTQLQNLALLESYYKYNQGIIPDKTPEGIQHPKFRLDVRQSQIPGAGKGLFIKGGKIKKGQVICTYPGLCYIKVPQGKIDQYGLNLRWPRGQRDYIITLENEIWIDGTPRLSVVSNATKSNIWARGHLINHPTKGFKPNCVQCVFDFGPEFVSESSKEFKMALGICLSFFLFFCFCFFFVVFVFCCTQIAKLRKSQTSNFTQKNTKNNSGKKD